MRSQEPDFLDAKRGSRAKRNGQQQGARVKMAAHAGVDRANEPLISISTREASLRRSLRWLRSPSAAAFQRAETILSVDWIEISGLLGKVKSRVEGMIF